jgi:hypothetical protein
MLYPDMSGHMVECSQFDFANVVIVIFEHARRWPERVGRMTFTVDFRIEPDGAPLGKRSARRQRNPSARHQALLELMKLFPETPLRLIAPDLRLGYPVRGPLLGRAGDTDAHGLRIDARLEYRDSRGRMMVAS